MPAKLAVSRYLLNDLFVTKVEQVEDELRKLSRAELRQIRQWLDDVIEDELEQAISGKVPPRAALDSAVRRGNEILRRFEKANP